MMEVMLSNSPPNACHHGAETETEGQNPVNAHPHEFGCIRVLSSRPDRLPGARAYQENIESRTQDDGGNQGNDTVRREDRP